MLRCFLGVCFKPLWPVVSFLISFPAFPLLLEALFTPAFPVVPSETFLYLLFFFLYSPTINTLTVIHFPLLKTEIVFAVILPRSNLSFLSQGKSYYDSAVFTPGGFSPAMGLRFF